MGSTKSVQNSNVGSLVRFDLVLKSINVSDTVDFFAHYYRVLSRELVHLAAAKSYLK